MARIGQQAYAGAFASHRGVQAYASSAESRIRGNLQSVLSRKFMETMSEYNECQQKYKSLYQEKAKRQYLIVKPNATDAEVEQVISGESKSVFADSMMSGGQQALNEMQDRHKDIVKLENSIRELHQLFVDMATMVDSQGAGSTNPFARPASEVSAASTSGELLDVIEHNVAEGLDYVKKGTGELVKAREYQRSANKVSTKSEIPSLPRLRLPSPTFTSDPGGDAAWHTGSRL
jgi:hypothetical protein